jgi:Holliday junction DNA helicase RuvB
MANAIRPTRFSEIIGQSEVITRLNIMVAGCKNSGGVMPHLLIDGPPGLGKTTIASAIATEMGVNLYTINAATVRSIKNILPYIMGMEKHSVLFIDEIHRLPKIVEEFLYPVMEDFVLNITVKDEQDKEKPETIELPVFTLVGATTSGGTLSQPFYDRFQIKEHLSFYAEIDLAKLAGLNANKLGLDISDEDLLEIAKRSKGTPRILNGRLQWYKNCSAYYTDKGMTVDEIFNSQGIDKDGLDVYDKMYLKVLANSKGAGLGLKSISALTGIAMDTIENSIEPYLVRKGFAVRTQKGRVIGSYKHE